MNPAVRLLLSLVCCSLLVACEKPVKLTGQASVAGAVIAWPTFTAQLLVNGEPQGEAVTLDEEGRFALMVPTKVKNASLVVAVEHGRYRLRAPLADEPGSTRVTPLTTASEALRTAGADTADAQLLGEITNLIHAVFYTAAIPGDLPDQDSVLLEFYADSWELALSATTNREYRAGLQLRYHDQLAVSAAVRDSGATIAPDEVPLNPELALMIRLDDSGHPLRWQHLSYAVAPWRCVDYLERGQRWLADQRGPWPAGTRLWAVDEQFARNVSAAGLQAQLDALNAASYCGYQGWRLPTRGELLSLTNPDSGVWDFPNSLPFAGIGRYWVSDDAGTPVIADLAADNDGMTTASAQAALLPLSFTADDAPPMLEPVTTPFDVQELRALYSQLPQNWPAPTVDDGVNWTELGMLPPVPFPQDNPYSPEKVALGKALFFDVSLSAQRNTACASCHVADDMWSDSRRVSTGSNGQDGRRNAMPVTNTAYNTSLFWDGRVVTLEEQSVHPVMDKLEMALTLDELVARIKEDLMYPPLFAAAFGDSEITVERFKQAVATFERTLISQPAAFDRFVAGDKGALTDEQIHGLHLYRTKARCMNCHSGPLLTDYTFRNTGLTYYGRSLEDKARFTSTFRPEHVGAFRVPSLRDVAFSAPYMHNGVFPVLARVSGTGSVVGVIPMYNAGMTKGRNGNYPQYQHKYDPFFPEVDALIKPLGMSNDEMLALADFLQAVSAPARQQPAPLEVLQNPAVEIPPEQP